MTENSTSSSYPDVLEAEGREVLDLASKSRQLRSVMRERQRVSGLIVARSYAALLLAEYQLIEAADALMVEATSIADADFVAQVLAEAQVVNSQSNG